jgi:hypothetical protein
LDSSQKEFNVRSIIFGSLIALTMGASAYAQDFGITAGLSESNASVSGNNLNGYSNSGEFGFRLGGVASFSLTDDLKFRTGLIYSQRHFDLKSSSPDVKLVHNFDYIDIPVLAQYNFNENFGVFGGLVAAINVNNNVSASGSGLAGSYDVTGTKGLYPIVQLGVNATFDNMYGAEAYYEFGLGDIYDNAKNYSVFGANFIYWL